MTPFVHNTYSAVKTVCTPHVIEAHSVAVHHARMSGKLVSPIPKPTNPPNFVRQWREHRGLTLEELAERIGMTHATVSRIESRKQALTDRVAALLAEALATDPASLRMRDPSDPEAIWSIWDRALPGERRQIVEVAKAILKTRQASG